MTVTVYHNPACGTSRNVLGILHERGIETKVVEYLKHPPSRDEVRSLAERAGVPLRALIRENGTPFDDLDLGAPTVTDEQLLDAIEDHPILLNRPIVDTGRAVKLCRPSETVLDLLPPGRE